MEKNFDNHEIFPYLFSFVYEMLNFPFKCFIVYSHLDIQDIDKINLTTF